jgi:hypothetical protein
VTGGTLTQVVGILVALGGISGLVIFFVTRWDKKRDPISKAEAEVALAAKALGMAEGLNDKLLREVTRLDERLEAADERLALMEERHAAERDEDRTKIAGLERSMSAVIASRDALVQYFIVFRGWVSNGMIPPPPAVPEHLADVIPAWVPGDGAEIPKPRLDPKDETHG